MTIDPYRHIHSDHVARQADAADSPHLPLSARRRCTCTLETVKVSIDAFPDRVDYVRLYDRVRGVLPPTYRAMSREAFLAKLMEVLLIPEAKFRLGKTQLLLKLGWGVEIQEMVDLDDGQYVVELVRQMNVSERRRGAVKQVEMMALTHLMR